MEKKPAKKKAKKAVPAKSVKRLYRFRMNCGRQGNLTDIFESTAEAVKKMIGREVMAHEPFGKHSSFDVTIEREYITEVKVPDALRPHLDACLELLQSLGVSTGNFDILSALQEEDEADAAEREQRAEDDARDA